MNALINKQTKFIDLGRIDYKQAWDYQAVLFDEILKVKAANRSMPDNEQQPTSNYLLFCEHPHVFTLGKSGDEKNLLITESELKQLGASYYPINRGGDITYHGPGQIVVYPVIDLENFYTDIHRYMRDLEEAVIQTLATLGLNAGRIPGLTGVWLDEQDPAKARKICALGVKTSRWVAMHGLAFNVHTDLKFFEYIVPCGIADKAVTSVEKELGKRVELKAVAEILKQKIVHQFEMQLV
jgi:lipoyl(octanoyl) transferase